MEGKVVHVLNYFTINSYLQLTGEFYLMALTTDEITTGLVEDKDSVPHCCLSPSPEGKLLPSLYFPICKAGMMIKASSIRHFSN